MLAGKLDQRHRRRRTAGRRVRQSQWVMEPAERDWCVRRLQRDHVLPLTGSLTYRQAALLVALLSTVYRNIRRHHT